MKDPADSSIALSLRLAKAGEFARAGRLKEAKSVLTPDGLPPENPLALHTLAALVTREGDYARALGLWRALLQRDPRNTEAQRMIAAIDVWTTRPAWYRFIPAAAGVTLLLTVSLIFWRVF